AQLYLFLCSKLEGTLLVRGLAVGASTESAVAPLEGWAALLTSFGGVFADVLLGGVCADVSLGGVCGAAVEQSKNESIDADSMKSQALEQTAEQERKAPVIDGAAASESSTDDNDDGESSSSSSDAETEPEIREEVEELPARDGTALWSQLRDVAMIGKEKEAKKGTGKRKSAFAASGGGGRGRAPQKGLAGRLTFAIQAAFIRSRTVDHRDGKILLDGLEQAHVHSFHPGECFGEIAVLYNSPRTATCAALSDEVQVAVLKKSDYDRLIRSGYARRMEEYKAFLGSRPMWNTINEARMTRLCGSMQPFKYPGKYVVVKEGTLCTGFHILKEGLVAISREVRSVSP
ncbi:hypothetical protein CYMTET_52443, partial [Cymbomonas tetramitiformis]